MAPGVAAGQEGRPLSQCHEIAGGGGPDTEGRRLMKKISTRSKNDHQEGQGHRVERAPGRGVRASVWDVGVSVLEPRLSRRFRQRQVTLGSSGKENRGTQLRVGWRDFISLQSFWCYLNISLIQFFVCLFLMGGR